MSPSALKSLLISTRAFILSGKSLSKLDDPLKASWKELLAGNKIGFDNYLSQMGGLVFLERLISAIESTQESLDTDTPDKLLEAIQDKFKIVTDKRCEVGQVLSHTRKQENGPYIPFLRNVYSVVLILEMKEGLFKPTADPEKFELDSLPCYEKIGFPSTDDPDIILDLCPTFFYRDELVPNTNIYGSGVLVSDNIVATAAHVIDEMKEANDPENIVLICGHLIYKHNKDKPNILEVKKRHIYQLDQKSIKINSQIINGDYGDAAFLKVKQTYPEYNISRLQHTRTLAFPKPSSKAVSEPVYALGHGLGVPMKLSFGGTVESLPFNNWFGCDLDIFPGNSGSPVFHATTHELMGIVSGPDTLWRPEYNNDKCFSYKINNKGRQAVQMTEIDPLIKKIQLL